MIFIFDYNSLAQNSHLKIPYKVNKVLILFIKRMSKKFKSRK